MSMTLSQLAVLLGAGVSAMSLFGLLRPASFVAAARGFPRSQTWGYALVALATGWFLYYLRNESVSDFAAYKSYMYLGFALLGVFTCLFLTDFLAVRGLAIVLLLLAKVMVDLARWSETSWRLVITIWAYVIVCLGMWLTVSPWRLRDMISWWTVSENRVRTGSAIKLAFGLFVLALGLTAYR
jgi:hypothetical protein